MACPTSLLVVTLLILGMVASNPAAVVVPIEASGSSRIIATGPKSPYGLPLRSSIIPPFILTATDLDRIDGNQDGRVTNEEWRRVFIILLAIYDSDGDGTLSISEFQAHNLSPPDPTTRLIPPPSKQKNALTDFKGQLGREHDHLNRKKEQMNRQRDRNNPRHHHRDRQEQRMQPWNGRP
ncbi:uncharacterized protein LOC121412171 [Lytechinus variegatus]|uniref:uncharacterized protein LOC121412171 n=1 Tax=Lytechinus variegatus TaxID=7654 RepID=UPI001BB2A54D|nr:uncharacterized protein LOC121412171 [Lytechinus variegatus]